jgi:hypothetical protein
MRGDRLPRCHGPKALFLRLLLLLALGALGFAHAADKRVALVIGNAKYPSAPLKNPVNDARDMAAALRKLGFEVIERTDASQKEMNRAIAQFGGKLTADSVALFYYAGHGMQVRGKNYLIPVDAQIDSEASVRVEAVDVDGILDQLYASPLNIVILDACRNNPFERRFRGGAGGLAQMEAPKGTLIAYATAPGKTAVDGAGRNGIYTLELLKLMQAPGLPIEQVFKRARANVARATADNQIPWEASSLTGDFYFIAEPAGSAATAARAGQSASPSAPPITESPAIELAYWESIKDSKDAADFLAYLEKYPDGQFAALAKNRVTVAESLAAEKKRGELAKDSIEGRWTWFINGVVTFKPDGTSEQENGTRGTWKLVDVQRRKYKISWEAGWVDDLYLSADGKKLEGSNQIFFPVSAVRVSP